MFRIQEEKRWVKISLWILLSVFFFLCVFTYLSYGESLLLGSFEKMDNDDVKYLRSAWTFLETGRLTYRYPDRDTVFIMPGLTLVLAGFVKLFGMYPILPFQIFQAGLMTFGLYLFFLIVRRIFNAKVGIIGLSLMVCYLPNVYVTTLLLTETIFATLFLLLFYLSMYAIEEKKMRYYLWGGIVLGVMVLFRPTILLFPIVIFAVWLIKKYQVREMLRFAIPVILIVCGMLTPWWARNYILFDRFIPLTMSSGNPMLQGTFVGYDQSMRYNEGIDYYKSMAEIRPDLDLDLYGHDEIITDQIETAMARIRFDQIMRKEPLKYLKWYTLGKTYENFKKPFVWKELYGITQRQNRVYHWILLIAGIAGFVFYAIQNRRKQKPFFWMMLISVLYFNCSHLPFYCFDRYVYPVMPFVIAGGGYWGYALLKQLKKLCLAKRKEM